jgi:hypothetical protein
MSGPGLIDLKEAASRMRRPLWKAREDLHDLHRGHGRVLFRAEGARNTKLWIDWGRVLEVDPQLRRRSEDVATRVDDLEREVAELRSKAAAWFRRGRQGR